MTDDDNPFTKMMTDDELQRADLIDYLQEVSEHIGKRWPQQRFELFCFGGCDDKRYCGRSNMTEAERRSMFEHLAINPAETMTDDTAMTDDGPVCAWCDVYNRIECSDGHNSYTKCAYCGRSELRFKRLGHTTPIPKDDTEERLNSIGGPPF